VTRSDLDADVVVVGAGIGGIAVVHALAAAGAKSDDILVLERASDVGGTWRDNVYPGVACDIPSALYSFSWRPSSEWTRRFAPGAEIQEYLRAVAHEEGVTARTRFGVELLEARWADSRECWELETSTGAVSCRVLVMATGRLSAPQIPAVPGLDTFPGRILHSSAWDPDLNLSDLRVGVVGSGASAVQLLPHVARAAGSTTLFQRTPAWIVPREDTAFQAADRDELFDQFEAGHAARSRSGPARDALRARALDHLASQVRSPALRADLTPTDEIGCRRILLSDEFYPTFDSGAAFLEPAALVGFDGSDAVSAAGTRVPLDAVVMATGFRTAPLPFAETVIGRHGRSLAEHWQHGMTAWATVMPAGFPNLFVIDGPNAALGHHSAVHMIETQAAFVAALLVDGRAHRRAHGRSLLEASADDERAWTAELDAAAEGTVWMSGCRSWYVDDRSGRLTLLWPGTATSFSERLRELSAPREAIV
jgi:cation diffusion facilitator CzcD-associated flavoprotein CzcO